MNCLDGSGKILDLAFDGYTSDRDRILKFPRLDATPNFILEIIADVEGGHRPLPVSWPATKLPNISPGCVT
jgi:hypothetical protein